VNSVCVVGKLTRAPSVRFEGEGMQSASFTLAITEPSREGKPFVLYVGCTSWGRSAEACSVLNADDLVSIVGKLAWAKRTGKCGQEHSVLCVNVRECTVLDAAAVEVPA
jgi:single-stranded DNA-binding protein